MPALSMNVTDMLMVLGSQHKSSRAPQGRGVAASVVR